MLIVHTTKQTKHTYLIGQIDHNQTGYNMRWKVIGTVTTRYYIDVEAETYEDALDEAEKQRNSDWIHESETNIELTGATKCL